MDCAIVEILGSESQAREDIQKIRFTPRSFYSADEDFAQSWQIATKRALTLLENILSQIRPASNNLLPLLESEEKIFPYFRPRHILQKNLDDKKEDTLKDPAVIIPAYLDKDSNLFDSTLSPGILQSPLLDSIVANGKKNILDKYLLEVEFAPESETIDIDEIKKWEGKNSKSIFKVSIDQSNLVSSSEKSPSGPHEPFGKEESAGLSPGKSSKFGIFGVFKTGEVVKKTETVSEKFPSSTEEKSKVQQLETAIQKVRRSKGQEDNPLHEEIDDAEKLSLKTPSVLVTCGNNQLMKDDVVSILEKLELKIVLRESLAQEETSFAQSIEADESIQFAIVVLCADEMGYKKTQTPNEAKARARQQLLFDLGFMVGKIGRDRVFVLHEDIEFPTGFFDVLYTPYASNGGWQLELLRQLKKAGFKVDANRLI